MGINCLFHYVRLLGGGGGIQYHGRKGIRGLERADRQAMSDKYRKDVPATGIAVKTKPKTKKPSMYKVLLLNDDYTPMEFVVHVLERFFGKNREDATRIMLHVHR